MQSLSQLERDIHPVVIIRAYTKALAEALRIVNAISIPIDTSSDEQMLSLIKTSIGTKFSVRWSDLMCKLALEAVRTVAIEASSGPSGEGLTTVDIKRYARVEKIPGGEIEDSRVLRGVMVNKDITPCDAPTYQESPNCTPRLSALVQKGGKSNEHWSSVRK